MLRSRIPLAVGLVLLLAGAAGLVDAAPRRAVAAAAEASLAPTQLPRGIRPLHYDVFLIPNAAEMRFDGGVAIRIEVARPTPSITLNAAGLSFTSVRPAPAAAPTHSTAAARIDLDAGAQTATFAFARPLRPGAYVLLWRDDHFLSSSGFRLPAKLGRVAHPGSST